MFVFVLLCITLCLFYFCNRLEEEENAGCCAFVVLPMSCYAVPGGWPGLLCVIVVSSDHTYFHVNVDLT